MLKRASQEFLVTLGMMLAVGVYLQLRDSTSPLRVKIAEAQESAEHAYSRLVSRRGKRLAENLISDVTEGGGTDG